MILPKITSYWLHKNGDIYEVVGYSNILSTNLIEYPILVNYSRLKDNSIWSKSPEGFIKNRMELPL